MSKNYPNKLIQKRKYSNSRYILKNCNSLPRNGEKKTLEVKVEELKE